MPDRLDSVRVSLTESEVDVIGLALGLASCFLCGEPELDQQQMQRCLWGLERLTPHSQSLVGKLSAVVNEAGWEGWEGWNDK